MQGPLKWHGGKHYLAGKIWDLVPDIASIVHVVEPYCGGASFTLEGVARGYEKSFMINDLNHDLMNFWQQLRDNSTMFMHLCNTTPFSEEEWENAARPQADNAHRAWAFFVRCRQSLAGRMDDFALISKARTRRGMNEQVSAWLSAVDGLPQVHAALRTVLVTCRDGIECMEKEDRETTLFYLDPPYLDETRVSKEVYDFEMTEKEHLFLLGRCVMTKGKVMISGYDSSLYRTMLSSWRRSEFDLPNNAAGGETKRRMTEVVWSNF